MSTAILSPELQQKQELIADCLFHLEELTREIDKKDLKDTVGDLRAKLQDPFLFVICGEVKAGKSSFINALLQTERDICEVSPRPCTDTIQQIMYSENEGEEIISEFQKKIFLPVDILKNISIVDTPGTNSIVKNHQEITEKYVPQSDLIVFVFPSKNPFTESAWKLFDFIKTEWRKKVIFILQQADLMNPADLQENLDEVRKIAQEKGVAEPVIFTTSALLEKEGKTTESGFTPLRSYIKENITGGDVYVLKLKSNLETSKEILGKIEEGTSLRFEQLKADKSFRAEIQVDIDEQEKLSFVRTDKMIQSLLDSYDLITSQARNELDSGLNFFKLAGRSIRGIFGKKEPSMKEWLNGINRQMEKDLRSRFQDNLEVSMGGISDSIKHMVKLVEDHIQDSTTILKSDNEIFGDIADKRQEAIKAIQENYTRFVENNENFIDRELTPKAASFMPDIATGGGLAIVGAILAATTNIAIVDVTGGLLTTGGLVFAGGTMFFKKRNVMEDFDNEIKNGRNKLKTTIEDQIKRYTHNIKERLNSSFAPLDLHINKEESSLNDLQGKIDGLKNKIEKTNRAL